jgi:hypothetical protein
MCRQPRIPVQPLARLNHRIVQPFHRHRLQRTEYARGPLEHGFVVNGVGGSCRACIERDRQDRERNRRATYPSLRDLLSPESERAAIV